MGVDSSVKLSQPSRFPGGRQQVAAVCYRIRKGGIEFLLVQTRGGRWIFPKGGVEIGLTYAQSAALEAVEEAGVHGRMEEIPFARYRRRKPHTATTAKPNPKNTRPTAAPFAQPELAVAAHLCEVSRQEPPQESNRNPTWFSTQKAKQRLPEDRPPEFGAELARVVDRALSRIQRLHSGAHHTPGRTHRDGLQEVRFEAHEVAVQVHLRRLLRIAPEGIQRPVLRLGTGADSAAEAVRNITAIDSRRNANLTNPGNLPSSKRKGPPAR